MTAADRYFDNAATTPIDPRVVEVMVCALERDFGNPNSIHSWGREAREQVEQARQAVADLLGAEDPFQITFTSGATESNNWILRSFERVAVSPFEHASVLETAEALGLSVLPNERWHVLTTANDFDLVSIMPVNNETGSIPTLPPMAGPRRHADLTQALGKVPISLDQIDFASWSAHKFYGPKGVGGLFAAELPPCAYQTGGEQEHGHRAGTLNVPAIVGMGEAARIAIQEQSADFDHASRLRKIVLEELNAVSDLRVNEANDQSPFILSISILGIQGETAVVELDSHGFGISSGAACSTQSTKPSRVLTALGVESEWIRGTVRISFGRANTADSAHELGVRLRKSIDLLRTI